MRGWLACLMFACALAGGCQAGEDGTDSHDGGTSKTPDAGDADAGGKPLDDAGGDASELPKLDGSIDADAEVDGGQEPDLVPEPIAPTQVGAAGATLSSATVTLQIPADVLSGNTTIAVTPLDAAARALLPSAVIESVFDGQATLTLATYAFTPHGASFADRVTIALHYGGVADVVLRLDDENDTTWERVSDVTFADGVATFEVYGFSIYAVTKMPPCKPCGAAAVGRECGLYYSETCGRHVDLVAECGRPGCDTATEGCGNDNACFGCVAAFDCGAYEAACGTGYDNCNYRHDLATECPELGACKEGKVCTTVVDQWAVGGQYDSCEIPCSNDDQCPAGEQWCEEGVAYASFWWCADQGYCEGNACQGCGDDSLCAADQ